MYTLAGKLHLQHNAHIVLIITRILGRGLDAAKPGGTHGLESAIHRPVFVRSKRNLQFSLSFKIQVYDLCFCLLNFRMNSTLPYNLNVPNTLTLIVEAAVDV